MGGLFIALKGPNKETYAGGSGFILQYEALRDAGFDPVSIKLIKTQRVGRALLYFPKYSIYHLIHFGC